MKCNETLPECRNCKIRQERIPCSYLSFTEQEKKEFLKRKALQESSANSTPNFESPSDVNSLDSSLPSSPFTAIEVKLVKHVKPTALQSQHLIFFNETQNAIQSRLYYSRLISESFIADASLFASHLLFSSYWIHNQLSTRLRVAVDNNSLTDKEIIEKEVELEKLFKNAMIHKGYVLKFLGNVIAKIIENHSMKDNKTAMLYFAKTSLPTICLQSADILTQDSLRFFFIDGTISVLNELYKGIQDQSPISNFIAKSVLTIHRALFTPNYSYEIFEEFYEFVIDLKPFVLNSKDLHLVGVFNDLIAFLENSIINSNLKAQYNPDFIMAYPPILVYPVFHQFYKIMPSEIFTINLITSPIHKLVYSIFYSLARVLDNVFPEIRFVTHYRFIGPTNIYPYDPIELVQSLPDELRNFGIYFTRILAFFSRRAEFFNKYMKILNPFPENLADHRFESRKVKVDEIFIERFKNVKITKKNYPQVRSKDLADLSINQNNIEEDSFANNFNAPFSLNMDFDLSYSRKSSTLSSPGADINILETYKILNTGLLECDYDPLLRGWIGQPQLEPMLSFNKFNEDRAIILRYFIRNEIE